MTSDQQDRAKHAARELARRLEPVTTLRDPYAAALAYVEWLMAEHWRCIPPPPDVLAARTEPDPPNDEWRAARAAITRKDDQ